MAQSENEIGSGITPAELRMVAAGQYIQAVKAVRTRTGLGLADAKSVVDVFSVAAGLRREEPCPYCQGRGKVTSWGVRS